MPDSSQGTFISVETVAVRAGMWSSLLSGLLLLFNFRIYSKRVVLSNKKNFTWLQKPSIGFTKKFIGTAILLLEQLI